MAWRVFYSYSHKDAALRDALATHLAPLRQQNRIEEWYDRDIKPGTDWHEEISSRLDSADLILLLVSADFLASDYCFGVEIDRAMDRLKGGEVEVVPILLRPCLWQDSRFSQLQIVPRDAQPVVSAASVDDALLEVAQEIRKLVVGAPPGAAQQNTGRPEPAVPNISLDLVRRQVLSYARLYERTRQRMKPSDARTGRMEHIMERIRDIATASYPLLPELAGSPSPGERLAAVSILQVFAHERYLPFLVEMIGSEKPFVGYHAVKALHFAVGALDASLYPQLGTAIADAQKALKTASAGFDTGRQRLLDKAEAELRQAMEDLAPPVK
jgi:hypothetical protein